LAKLGKLVQLRPVYERLGHVRSGKKLMRQVRSGKAMLDLVKAG